MNHSPVFSENQSASTSTVEAVNSASFEQLAQGHNATTNNSVLNRDNKWYRKLFALPAYYWVIIAQVV
ncbi:MAG: hypothetical protein ACTH5M_10475, partial [Psychrobacter sp.]